MDGSSMRMRPGFTMSARARERICFSPPERFPALSRIFLLRRGYDSSASSIARWTAFSSSRAVPPISRFSRTVSDGKTFRPWGIKAIPRRTFCSGSSRVMSFPSKLTVPFVGFSRPKTVFSRVDFPEPLGPMMQTISPLGCTDGCPVKDLDLAVAGVDVCSFQSHHPR